jgi:single-strand DNA-binding protein
MVNFNKVILAGNLTRDPRISATRTQAKVANCTVAVNRVYKTKEGKVAEETAFIDFEAWARQAEVIEKYCKIGSPLLIEGRLKLNTWETDDKQKRSKLVVVAERIQLLGNKKKETASTEPTQEGSEETPF